MLSPSATRILRELGLEEELTKKGEKLKKHIVFNNAGKKYGELNMEEMSASYGGAPFLGIQEEDFNFILKRKLLQKQGQILFKGSSIVKRQGTLNNSSFISFFNDGRVKTSELFVVSG